MDFQPDLILPSQTETASIARCGEYTLWAAVLAQALDLARGRVNTADVANAAHARRIRDDARSWIDTVNEIPCGFDWVCHVLGVDPEWMRENFTRRLGTRVKRIMGPRASRLAQVQPTRDLIRAAIATFSGEFTRQDVAPLVPTVAKQALWWHVNELVKLGELDVVRPAVMGLGPVAVYRAAEVH